MSIVFNGFCLFLPKFNKKIDIFMGNSIKTKRILLKTCNSWLSLYDDAPLECAVIYELTASYATSTIQQNKHKVLSYCQISLKT